MKRAVHLCKYENETAKGNGTTVGEYSGMCCFYSDAMKYEVISLIISTEHHFIYFLHLKQSKNRCNHI